MIRLSVPCLPRRSLGGGGQKTFDRMKTRLIRVTAAPEIPAIHHQLGMIWSSSFQQLLFFLWQFDLFEVEVQEFAQLLL